MIECRKLPADMADILKRINDQADQTPEGERSFPLLDLYRNLDVRSFFETGAQTKDAFLYMSETKLAGLALPYMGKESFLLKDYDANVRCLFEATGYPKEKIDRDIAGLKAAASDPLAGIVEGGVQTVDDYIDALSPVHRSVYLALDLFGEISAAYGADGKMDRDEYTAFVEYYFGPEQTDEEFNANGQRIVENAHVILGLVSFLSTPEPEKQPTSLPAAESPSWLYSIPTWSWYALGAAALSVFSYFAGKWSAGKGAPSPTVTAAGVPPAQQPPSQVRVQVAVTPPAAEAKNNHYTQVINDLGNTQTAPKTQTPSALAAAASPQPAFKATFWMGRDPGANGVALNLDSAIPGSATLVGRKQVAIQFEAGSYYAVDQGKNTGLVTVKRSGGSFPMSRDVNAPTALVVGDVIDIAGVEKVFTNSADPASAFQDSNGVHISHSLVGTLANPLATAANGVSVVQAPSDDAIRGAILTELPAHMFAPDGKTLLSGYEAHVLEMLDEAKKGGALTSANLTESVRDVVYDRLSAWSVDASLETADKATWKKAAEEIRDRKFADALKTSSQGQQHR